MITHHWAIAGLVLNIVGAALLLRFPPIVTISMEDGSEISTWVLPATKRRHGLQRWGFRVAIAALAMGFAFQLVDLLRT
jgi:hypothetical protein